MTKAGKTATLPETALPVALDGPDLVTALRIFGASGEFPLLARQGTFTLGSSPSCDVAKWCSPDRAAYSSAPSPVSCGSGGTVVEANSPFT
jgi:hypothetical protein